MRGETKKCKRKRESEELDRAERRRDVSNEKHTKRRESEERVHKRREGSDERHRRRDGSDERPRRRDGSGERSRQRRRESSDDRDRGRDDRRRRDDDTNRHRDQFKEPKHRRDRDGPRSKWDDDDSQDSHRNSKKEVWGKKDEKAKAPVENVAKPDFGLSGKLAEEVNTYKGVVIKYAQPPEARMPKRRWRLYPFKGEESLPTLYIHRQSAYLIGRERKIVDIPVDHPSISKQHAVLQYRLVPYTKEDGTKARRIRPYIIDLESANGTFVNNKKIETSKFVELLERDVIKFAYSSREYVLLHEHSQNDEDDDDNENENAT